MIGILLSSIYLSTILTSLGISKVSFDKQKDLLKKDGFIFIDDITFNGEVKKAFPVSLIVFLPVTNIIVSSLIYVNLEKYYDIELEELLEKNIIKFVDSSKKSDNNINKRDIINDKSVTLHLYNNVKTKNKRKK